REILKKSYRSRPIRTPQEKARLIPDRFGLTRVQANSHSLNRGSEMFRKLSRWMPSFSRKKTIRNSARTNRAQLRLEGLEVREVAGTHGGTDLGATNNWSDAGNWTGGVPSTGEAGGTVVQIPINDSSMYQDISGLVINQLEFKNSASAVLTLNKSLGISG